MMHKWFPLHQHSHFSLLDGLSKPEQIADRLVECGYSGGALSDHGNICGVPVFHKSLKSVCLHCRKQKDSCVCGKEKYKAAKLKAISGTEFYICQDDPLNKDKSNGYLSHLVVLAKNLQGWKNLMKATSNSFMPENFYKKPRLNLEKLSKFGNNEFICFSGHMGSDLANICFEEPKLAYKAASYEDARSLVRKDWKSQVKDLILKYQSLFGKENFYVEIQLIDHINLPASLVVARILRFCAKEMGCSCVATADSHYPRKEDAADQRILLCSMFETTLKQVQTKIDNDEDVILGGFFKSNNYHIPSLQEMIDLHGDNPEELSNSIKIAEQCEIYQIGGKPLFPKFPCPNNKDENEYLKELCISGWDKKIKNKIPVDKQEEYRARLWDKEIPILTGAGLSSYFLVVADYIDFAVKQGYKVGKGRGSSAGSLVAYLTGITRVDPIKADLSFERFYNAGRNSPGRIAFPDIDTDFPIFAREPVCDYIRKKYGEERVCQMATFSRMQGRGALKDVLRAHERCSFEEMNLITEHIPDESKIIDKLQEMREEGIEPSIIKWALENNVEALKKWCWIDENGELQGDLALDFAQAIRLEGTKRNMGKHASGLVICSDVLTDIAPMGFDKSSGRMMVVVEMKDAEDMGLPKFDILGLRTLDNLGDAESIIRTGKARPK